MSAEGLAPENDLQRRFDALMALPEYDPVTLVPALHELVAEAAAVGRVEVEAQAVYQLAKFHIDVGNIDEGAANVDRARELFDLAGDRVAAIRTGLGRMAVANWRGRPRESIAIGLEMVAELDELRRQDSDAGRIALLDSVDWMVRANLAMSWTNAGEHTRALDTLEGLVLQAEREKDPESEMRTRVGLGMLLLDMGRPAQALEALEHSHRMLVALGNPFWLARCSRFVAKAQAMLGRYMESLASLAAAQRWLEDLDPTIEGYLLQHGLAEVYQLIGHDDAAIDILAEVLPRMHELSMPSELASAMILSAELLVTANPSEARRRFEEVHDVLLSTGDEVRASRALMQMVELLGIDDDHIDRVEAAAEVLERAGTPIDRLRWRVARLASPNTDLATAEVLIDEATALAAETAMPHLIWQLELRRGQHAVATGRLDIGHRALRQAVESLHRIRLTLPDERLRLRYLAANRRAFDELLAVLLDLGQHVAAFALLDEEYSITLHERLGGRLGPSLSFGDVNQELGAIYAAMLDSDEEKLEGLRAREAVLATAVVHSEHASHRGGSCLVYGVNGDEVFALLRVDGRVSAHRGLVTVSELAAMRRDFHLHRRRLDLLKGAAHREQLAAISSDLLRRFHDRLIGPFESRLVGVESLDVVPPPGSSDLPFAGFLGDDGHLSQHRRIALAPSASVAAHVAARARRGRRTLAIGFDGDGDRPSGATAPHLSHAVVEARRVAVATSATALVGDTATMSALRSSIDDHDVVHLACHAEADATNPWRSRLRLADGWLSAEEVSRWQLDGQLIVLSGCETGVQHGDRQVGIEQLGLPRSFLAAGAVGVVVALWEIGDERTVEFMVRLHGHLASCAPAEAVRRTQSELIEAGLDLRHWAAFSHIGNACG